MEFSRRKLLLAAGGVTIAALGADCARRVWAEIAADVRPANALAARHEAIIASLADAILPATETPGALDIGVPSWVAYVLADSFGEAERQELLGGHDSLDERARGRFDRGIAELTIAQLHSVIGPLDDPGRFEHFADRVAGVLSTRVQPNDALGRLVRRFGLERRGYLTIKSLVLHGYFTSELVQRGLMKVQWA